MSDKDTAAEGTISDQTELDTIREGIDDPQVLKAQLAKEAQARRQITARAIRAEEDKKAIQIALDAYKTAHPENTNNDSSQEHKTYEINDEVVDMRLDGFSKKEVEWVMANGGRKALDDANSLVSIAIKASREQSKAEAAASATRDTTGLSEVERKYTLEQMAVMPLSDLEKILPHTD